MFPSYSTDLPGRAKPVPRVQNLERPGVLNGRLPAFAGYKRSSFRQDLNQPPAGHVSGAVSI